MNTIRYAVVVILFFILNFPAAAQDSTESLTLPGLDSTVEILYDEWGIPHIYASNLHDLFFAQGYAQARDRWWQMEWWRHLGNGRLGEIAGASLLGEDVFVRTLGGYAVVQRELTDPANAEINTHLQAFADGVNAYIGGREPGELAVQYPTLALAGLTVEVDPWTPADTLIWSKVMAFALSQNMGIEMLLAELAPHLSVDMIDDFAPPFPYGEKPTILQDEDLPIEAESVGTPSSASQPDVAPVTLAGSVPPDYDFRLGSGLNVGSNNWVVGGALTASGQPMLANDPHLSIQMPSIWYEIALHCQPLSADCPLNAAG
ncbi:MAG: penicillin acylase family protein, partial [Anaerolineae bacterium]|nr:penicillin acylase family protein [Anaerolineae bacterium]